MLMIAACRTAPSKAAANHTPDVPVVRVTFNPTLTPGLCDACELDAEGKLDEALPLYQRRASATGTHADRLRYAKALMRAGQTAPAAKLFDDLLTEGQVMGGHDSRAFAAGLNASALLEDGFPRSALHYAESAAESGDNPITALLLIRSLSAAGEQARARNAIDDLARNARQLPFGQRLELARWHALVHANSRTSEQLLYAKQADTTAELYRYSVLADFPMLDQDWARLRWVGSSFFWAAAICTELSQRRQKASVGWRIEEPHTTRHSAPLHTRSTYSFRFMHFTKRNTGYLRRNLGILHAVNRPIGLCHGVGGSESGVGLRKLQGGSSLAFSWPVSRALSDSNSWERRRENPSLKRPDRPVARSKNPAVEGLLPR
jgi:hypothetical protein